MNMALPAKNTDSSIEYKEYHPLPTIKKFHECTSKVRCIVGPVGCLSGDTEYLTPVGWRRIDKYEYGGLVGQWDKDTGELSFVLPEGYAKLPCDLFWHFKNEHSLSMVVSDEHRVPLYDYRGNFVVKQASQLAKTPSRHTVPINYRPDNFPGLGMSEDLIRLAVAIHADGHIPDVGFQTSFSLRKDRKKERLRILFKNLNLQWSERTYSVRPTETIFKFYSPYTNKHYDDEWWDANTSQLAIIVDEMRYWDGLGSSGEGDVRFYTTCRSDADFIQYAVHATGSRATVSIQKDSERNPDWKDSYIVNIAENNSKSKVMFRGDHTQIDQIPSSDGFKYCFTVPTSYFLVRHNGRIFITGNSGKTVGAMFDIAYYLPFFLYNKYGIKNTRWVVLRNSYRELEDSTIKTIQDWFPDAHLKKMAKTMDINYAGGINSQLLFRSCDRPEDVKKFKSVEFTGYWIDESIEVAEDVKLMLKNRVGRFPSKQTWYNSLRKKYNEFVSWPNEKLNDYMEDHPERFLTKFGIETTNPPDVEHPTYSQFKWDTPPPGPIPVSEPLGNHVGFWQPPGENEANLTPRYYDDLRNDYKDNPDWADMYIEGKPGITIKGKLVYANFNRRFHVAEAPLLWSKGPLFRGWDNSGNCPACIVAQIPTAEHVQVLAEFHTDKQNIVDFTKRVVLECNNLFPGATYTDWADPAGNNEYSTREGTFTSNAKLMRDACGVNVIPSEQNLTARINAVDDLLSKRDGILIDPGCIRLINGFMGGYCYQEIGTTGVYSPTPWKNKFSHGADSLQYLLIKLTKGQSGNSLIGWTPTR